MVSLLLILSLVLVAGSLLTAAALRAAREGHETEEGFHLEPLPTDASARPGALWTTSLTPEEGA
jgi:hypothetical protein